MPATLVTNSALGQSNGIVLSKSGMRIDRSGLVSVEAVFAFKTSNKANIRPLFEKGDAPPVALSNLDLPALQEGNVFLTEVDFSEEYGITRASARYAGARSIELGEIDCNISSTILNVTESITREAKPGYWTINLRGLNAMTFRVSENFVRGGSIGLGVGGSATFTPGRPSKTFLLLDSIWRVHSFTYRFASHINAKLPPLEHSLAELVIPVSGRFKRLDAFDEFLPIISDEVEVINSKICLYTKTFSAERIQGLIR
jgi:hypothetical protein